MERLTLYRLSGESERETPFYPANRCGRGRWENLKGIYAKRTKIKGDLRSNQAIWRMQSYFCFHNFSNFPISYWGANSYYPRVQTMRKVKGPINCRCMTQKALIWVFSLHPQRVYVLFCSQLPSYCRMPKLFLTSRSANDRHR